MARKLLGTHERVLAIVILGLAVIIGLRNPAFFGVATLFDLLRSCSVMGLFALGTLAVLLSGGIDVSFAAVGAFSMYATVKLWSLAGLAGPAFAPFAVSAAIGLGLGLLNAALVAGLRLPALIATLGTAGVFRGLLLFAVGSTLTRELPAGMDAFSRARLIAVRTPDGAIASLHPAALLLAGAAVAAWLLLRFTLPGRALHAVGDSPEAAARIGIGVGRIRTLAFAIAGALAGLAGAVHASLDWQADPASLNDKELDVIAAVVLGGASISGGRGTVGGTLLGVVLVTLVANNLALAGIPAAWQKVGIGAAIIAGTGIPALRASRAARRGPAGRAA